LRAVTHFLYDALAYDEQDPEDKYLLIGFDRAGNLLEILYNEIDEEWINVFHAMPCRNKYLPLLEGENQWPI